MINVKDNELTIIKKILRNYANGAEVRIFGSRYKGSATKTSDLDIAIVGKEKLDLYDLAVIQEAFEESMLPFRVDVLDWHRISIDFRNHIEEGYATIDY